MLGQTLPVCLARKSILVRTGRCSSGCGGRKLFPSGAFGCSGVPCMRRRSACNCAQPNIWPCSIYQNTKKENWETGFAHPNKIWKRTHLCFFVISPTIYDKQRNIKFETCPVFQCMEVIGVFKHCNLYVISKLNRWFKSKPCFDLNHLFNGSPDFMWGQIPDFMWGQSVNSMRPRICLSSWI